MKAGELAVFLSYRSVKFHPRNVKTFWKSGSSIHSKEIKKNTQELSREKNCITYHRRKKCFLTDLTKKNQEQK